MLHCGGGQRGVQADADHPCVSAWKSRGADGQKHHDAQSHPWSPGEQSCSGEVSESINLLRALLNSRISTVQRVWCCIVVPPAERKMSPAMPVCPHLTAVRDARFQTLDVQTLLEINLCVLKMICSDRLLPHVKGNVGFVFTKEDLTEVRDMLLANKVKQNK